MINTTEKTIETLKSFAWIFEDNEYYTNIQENTETVNLLIRGLCNIEMETLRKCYGNNDLVCRFVYYNTDDNRFVLTLNIRGSQEVIYADSQIFDTDILYFYPVEEEHPTLEQLKDLLNKLSKNYSAEDIVCFLEENCVDIPNKIRENCLDNMDESDKEDIAADWIERNPEDAWDKAWDNMDSYTIKDKVIEYIQDNL